MPSDLQITNIKDQANANSAITIASDGQVTISQNNPTLTLGSNATFPTGHVLQVLQYYKTDRDTISGSASSSDGTNANNFAFIPGQGSDAVFQQSITTTGSNKVLITHNGNYGSSAATYLLMFQLFRGAAVDTVVGSCTKLGAGGDVGNTQQTECNSSLYTASASGMVTTSFSYLDSPGAGTHYYKLGWLGQSGANYYIGRTGNDTNAAYIASTASALTVMEIKA